MKLICLPYAGGSASVYYPWKQYLNSKIELVAIELSGRGRRFGQPLYSNFSQAVDDIFVQIQACITDSNYMIFGHSMGSTLAFELVHRMMSTDFPLPNHIVFSGRIPPHRCHQLEKIHDKPFDVFVKRIVELGGTPGELFENEETTRIFLPILRSDYSILEKYEYLEYPGKIPCGTSIFYGKEDTATQFDWLQEWDQLLEQKASFYEFNGRHFYIKDNIAEVTRVLNSICLGQK